MAGELNDKQYIFTLLTALVKREQTQEIRISEEELIQVTKMDALALMWDPNTSEIVLKVNPVNIVPNDLSYEN